MLGSSRTNAQDARYARFVKLLQLTTSAHKSMRTKFGAINTGASAVANAVKVIDVQARMHDRRLTNARFCNTVANVVAASTAQPL